MGARVEEHLAGALRAYLTQDEALAKEVSAADAQVDLLELEIDRACIQLLARRQPVASDLRFITTALKVVTDLERVGDLATNICDRVLDWKGESHGERLTAISEMGEAARNMLHDAMDALVASDAEKAREIVERDRIVDEQYAALFPVIARKMSADPSEIGYLMRSLSIAKYIERIADHATNLAEMVVFMVEGRDVRHLHAMKEEESERSERKERIH